MLRFEIHLSLVNNSVVLSIILSSLRSRSPTMRDLYFCKYHISLFGKEHDRSVLISKASTGCFILVLPELSNNINFVLM